MSRKKSDAHGSRHVQNANKKAYASFKKKREAEVDDLPSPENKKRERKFEPAQLRAEWTKYRTKRTRSKLPYTLESWAAYMKMPMSIFNGWLKGKDSDPRKEICLLIHEEIQSSLLDFSITKKNPQAYKIVQAHDQKTYGDKIKEEIDKRLEVYFKRVDGSKDEDKK